MKAQKTHRRRAAGKLGLVLSGGGARGLAHVGVLQALEEAGIRVDLVVGCSFGALVGAMYAQTASASEVRERMITFIKSDTLENLGLSHVRKNTRISEDFFREAVRNVANWVMINVVASRLSVLKSDRLKECILMLIEDASISETRIPFAANATDLVSGNPYYFTEGSIVKAVLASSSIPGYFPPVAHEGRLLSDGAISYNLPVDLARSLGADVIIGVDVHPQLQPETDLRNVIDVILRANAITGNTLSRETVNKADLLIAPPVKEYFWYEYERYPEIIAAGYEITLGKIAEIQRLLQSPRQQTSRQNRLFKP